METEQLRTALEDLNFSAAMPAEVLQQLAAACRLERVEAGQFLFRESGDNETLYLIREGRLALEMNIPGQGQVRILTLGPGEMAGWSALLGKGRMTATAVAVRDTDLIAAASSELLELCESNHQFGFYMMRQMADALSKRLVATRLQLLDLFADAPTAQNALRDQAE